MKWYEGPTLMMILENIKIESNDSSSFCMPIQYVNRPHQDFRGFSGTVSSGNLKVVSK